MPFDKGRKRKLVDTCGHERCYSCMFKNEACPLCFAEKGKLFGRNYYLDNKPILINFQATIENIQIEILQPI